MCPAQIPYYFIEQSEAHFRARSLKIGSFASVGKGYLPLSTLAKLPDRQTNMHTRVENAQWRQCLERSLQEDRPFHLNGLGHKALLVWSMCPQLTFVSSCSGSNTITSLKIKFSFQMLTQGSP